jgi:hypothetical protein
MNFGGAVRVNKCGVVLALGLLFLLLLYTYQGKEETSPAPLDPSDESRLRTLIKVPPPDPNVISLQKLLIASVDLAQKGEGGISYV